MHNEFTAIIEKDEGWYIAYCAEIPGANGQGRTKEECLKNLREAVEFMLEDRRSKEDIPDRWAFPREGVGTRTSHRVSSSG